MTRREFCIAAAAAQAMAAVPSFGGAADGGKKRWYKGNMHCHTYWSDGRAFPDQAIRSYRDAGYDFCAVTDHNRMVENRDFYASCGVDLEDVRFDGKTLYVSVPAKKGVTYTIKFITTKRGVDTGVVHTVSVPSVGQPDKGGRPARTVPVYSREIGATVKSVPGDKGHRLAAEYSLAADDLYVRARVESDEPALYYTTGGDGPMHPKTSTAWTQPYQRT